MSSNAPDLLASFAAFDEPVTPQLCPVDRSTLEMAAECPALERYISSGVAVHENRIMATGQEGHDAVARTISEYVASRGSMNVGELADYLTSEVLSARPDVQPDVIAAMRPSIWSWCRFIAGSDLRWQNILRWDGGEGEHSGQLAIPFDGLGLAPTSEVDLLTKPVAAPVLHLDDYKAGWKFHSHLDVATSFQFQFHWVLIAHNYPEIEALSVRVWNMRKNRRTHPVLFDRRDLDAFTARVRHAAGVWLQNRHRLPGEADAWPGVEKCLDCPAARVCPKGKLNGETPVQLLEQYIVQTEAVKLLEKRLWAEVKRSGGDIVLPNGDAFGNEKPRKTKKPTNPVYQVGKQESEETDASDL